jgi:hypothetical protein
MKSPYVVAVLLAACSSGPAAIESEIPADYATTYTKVRPCLPSIEHGTVNVVVFAAPDAVATYHTLMGEFSEGALLLKEEYARADQTCTGRIRRWTAGQKLAAGSSPATLDWHWQELDIDGAVTKDNDQTCIACHTNCVPGGSEGGYRYICSAPGQ